jgi:uncharacterized membrane protein
MSRTFFYEKYVATGKVKLAAIGERARGVFDDDIDRIAEEIRTAPTPPAAVHRLTDEEREKARQAQAAARKKRAKGKCSTRARASDA